jgi:hypothetical protein
MHAGMESRRNCAADKTFRKMVAGKLKGACTMLKSLILWTIYGGAAALMVIMVMVLAMKGAGI